MRAVSRRTHPLAKKKPGKQALVVQHNNLVDAMQRMDLLEMRLLRLALTKIDSRQPYEEGRELVVPVTAIDDWYTAFGGSRTTAYRDLQRACLKLHKCPVVIPRGEPGKYTVLNWVFQSDYDGGRVELHFTPPIARLLTGLTREFTRYNLVWASRLRTTPSWRLYELLQRRQDFGKYRVSIEELRRVLTPEGGYANAREFNRTVVKPAVKAISARTNLSVTVATELTLRKTSHYVFTFTVNEGKSPLDDQQGELLEETPGEFIRKHTDRKWREGLDGNVIEGNFSGSA